MTLKVIRYKNYGCTMISEDDTHKFFFSFYELNSGEIIGLTLIETFFDGKLDFLQYEFSYTKIKLKNGAIINYKFGKAKANDENGMSNEFYEWFESDSLAIDIIDYYAPYGDEEKCVKDFYLKNVESNKDFKTDTIEV